jgi:Na+-translocating ferredoxin:NAD+ oxidoreductase RnfG subunit
MKALLAVLITVAATLFFACNTPNSNTTTQLKDEAQRKAIISELLANHNYTMQLMDSMKVNNHAKEMMTTDADLMQMMTAAKPIMMMDNMMSMMDKDSATCRNMCKKMIGNTNVKSMMHEMIQNQGEKIKTK